MRSKAQLKSELSPLWIAIFSDILGFSIMSPIFAYIVSSPLEASLLMAVNAFFSVFSAPIWGRLSDKYGRKPMLGVSQLGTIVGFLMMAFSRNNLGIIFLSRVVDGIFGGNFPIAKAILSDLVPPHERSLQMSNVGLTRELAQLFGPALGGYLYKYTGIFGTGIVAAIFCVFSLFYSQIKLQETAPSKTGYIFYEKTRNNENSHLKPFENIDSPVKIISNTGKNSSNSQPSLKNNKMFMILMAQTSVEALSMIIILTNINMFAKMKFNISVEVIGLILSVVSLLQITIRLVLMRFLLHRLGDYKGLLVGLSSQLIFYSTLGIAPNIPVFIGLLSLKAFAGTLTKPTIDGYASKIADPVIQGRVQGISSAMNTLAMLFGPIIGGIILQYLPFQYFGLVSLILVSITIGLTLWNIGLKELDSKKLYEDHINRTK